ncbi:MAG: hypothetical protein KGL39_52815 [Patescibacteria group bacterium]|nr:hypothetical protein [Patescibacteria group bacterium]
MEVEHSPGPWRFALFDHEPNIAFVQWGTGYCEVHGARGRREINARLIAAAPELLEALEEILPYADGIEDSGPINAGWQSPRLSAACGKARAAIAKAIGATE